MIKNDSVVIKRLTNLGMSQFAELLGSSNETGNNLSNLKNNLGLMLQSSSHSEPTSANFTFSEWPRRLELAEALHEVVGVKSKHRSFASDRHFWAGLSAQYLHWLLENDIPVQIGEPARWLPQSSALRRHRHLLYGPLMVYEANLDNPKSAMAVLATPPLVPGEVVERVAGKANFMRGAAVQIATRLYYDEKTGKLKPGSSAHGPGGPRRLSYFLSQIDLTIDYAGMKVDELAKVLPKEFESWLA